MACESIPFGILILNNLEILVCYLHKLVATQKSSSNLKEK